jgi:GxxExxY protein
LKTTIDHLTEKVIGAAMEVHRVLGPGFLEAVYQNALVVELTRLGVAFRQQASLSVSYKGLAVGDFVADLIIEERLILELKAVASLATAHEVQLVNYLTATGCETGLLLNFGAASLQFRRKFKDQKNPVNLVNPVKRASEFAFTILELLVAMAVMAVLLVLLLNMVDSSTKLWRENENRVDAYREARAALGIMSRDLRNALTGAANANQFLVNLTAFPNLPNESRLVSDTNQGAALFFLTALPSKAQESGSNKSDVCQVGYFMAFGKSSSASNSPINTMNIYRYILSSDPTFARLTNTSGSLFPNDLTTLHRNVELLARNVTRFTAKAYTLTNNSLVTFSASANTPLPDIVELSVAAINQDAAKKLPSLSEWTNSTNPVIRPVEQTFTTRVNLNRPR